MTVAKLASEFLDNLEESHLLTLDEIDAAIERLDLPEDAPADTAAKAFIKEGLLTRFQAVRLLEGRARGFFIDHFRIEDILGSGGMGWVYIAKDLQSGEKVALKMLCAQSEQDAGLLARFKLEARAGMMLDHHAIVRTRSIAQTTGLYGEIYYTVMDFVPGLGLDELVAMGGPVQWPVACHIGRHVAAGLFHAHRKGLIHRDIKPANVLVDEFCNARILDFGLSLVSRSDQGDEFSLAMIFGQDCLGTADYIAPEQSIDSFAIDHRADLYSLGATLFFLMTGQVLFPDRKTRQEKIEAQQKLTPPLLRSIKPDIPVEVEVIVNRMLAKRPEDRFPNGKTICEVLAPFAKPTRIHFDFQKVLDRRYAIAQQRQQMLDQKLQRAAQATSLTMCSLDSRTTKPGQAMIDTSIRKDTQIAPPRVRESGPSSEPQSDG